MTFTPIDGAVCITQPGHRPVRLQPRSVDELLEIFSRENAVDLYNALLDAWEELQSQSA